MQVLLVRHAYAGDPDPEKWPDDDLRPITKKGARKFVPAAQGLGKSVNKPDRVLAAPAARTWQTARLLSDQTGWPHPIKSELLDDGAYAEGVSKKLDALWDEGDRVVVLVGHGPQLATVISYLMTGEDQGKDVNLKKGGAALIDYTKPGESELKWVMPRKALARLAD